MHIQDATISVTDVTTAGDFYARQLGLPVTERGDSAVVHLGASTLTLRPGPAFTGEHHVALEVAPEDFASTLAFSRRHLAPLSVHGSDVIVGPGGWDSQSVYFRGPDRIVLEYIARNAHRGRSSGQSSSQPDGPPRVTCLSEVGVGVDDVPATVTRLGRALDLPPFPPQSDIFAPVGDHDGLLILVERERTWFPTDDASPAQGPLTVTLAGDGSRPVDLVLSATTTITSVS